MRRATDARRPGGQAIDAGRKDRRRMMTRSVTILAVAAIAFSVAPVAMGIVLVTYSINAVYWVGAMIALVMIFLTWWLVR